MGKERQRTRRFYRFAVLALLAVALIGCNSKDTLSRSKAKQLFEASTGSIPLDVIALTEDEVESGIAAIILH
jgi:outer membrane lipoprotein SlyB